MDAVSLAGRIRLMDAGRVAMVVTIDAPATASRRRDGGGYRRTQSEAITGRIVAIYANVTIVALHDCDVIGCANRG